MSFLVEVAQLGVDEVSGPPERYQEGEFMCACCKAPLHMQESLEEELEDGGDGDASKGLGRGPNVRAGGSLKDVFHAGSCQTKYLHPQCYECAKSFIKKDQIVLERLRTSTQDYQRVLDQFGVHKLDESVCIQDSSEGEVSQVRLFFIPSAFFDTSPFWQLEKEEVELLARETELLHQLERTNRTLERHILLSSEIDLLVDRYEPL